jgi:hypothetical protein
MNASYFQHMKKTLLTKTNGEPSLENSRRFFITFQEHGKMKIIGQ